VTGPGALRTPICDLFRIDVPIVQTGMGWVAGPRLVSATAEAGGLGILASATMDFRQLQNALPRLSLFVVLRHPAKGEAQHHGHPEKQPCRRSWGSHDEQAFAALRFVNCRNSDAGIFLDQFHIHAANISDDDTHAISPFG